MTNILKSIKETKGGMKIFEISLKPFPHINSYYQKKSSEFVGPYLLFSPKDYNSNSPLERKEMAFKDAKNHEDFYKKLIKRGVYPDKTKVKVRKKRHSDSFYLEMKVPKIKEVSKLGSLSKEEKDNLKWGIEFVQGEIKSEGKRKGYNFKNVEEFMGNLLIPARPTYYEDIYGNRNYGIDSSGKVRYFDGEILIEKLPFNGRKKTDIEKKVEFLISDNSLEKRVILGFLSIAGFIFSLFFLSSNLTGNVVGNLDSSSNNIAGILILFVSFLFAFMALKR